MAEEADVDDTQLFPEIGRLEGSGECPNPLQPQHLRLPFKLLQQSTIYHTSVAMSYPCEDCRLV